MKITCTPFLLFLFGFLASCGSEDDVTESFITSISGKAQKGPFINGSSVVVFELDQGLNPTGRSFSSKITSPDGSFNIDSVSLSSPFVQVEVEGLYYSEVDGNVSFRELTVNSLAKISEGEASNVNLVTQIENTRIKNLVRTGLTFEEAKKQSLSELIEVLGYPYEVNSISDKLDLYSDGADGIFLFCLSAIILATNNDYDAAQHASWLNFLLELEADFGDNGKIDSPDLENQLKLGAFYTLENASEIRDGFERTIQVTGASIQVPFFEPIIQKLFKGETEEEPTTFGEVSDFFPTTSSEQNIANVLDGSLITDEKFVLSFVVPSAGTNYTLSIQVHADSEDKLGSLQVESPAWTHYDIYEDVSFWSLSASIELPSNNLIGKVEIPFEYEGMGRLDLSAHFVNENGDPDDFNKSIFWNKDILIPNEVDTVIISDPNIDYINYQVHGLEKPSYLVFKNVESVHTVAFVSVLNLYGVEFPQLKTVTNEFNFTINPVLTVFEAPKLEKINGHLNIIKNPMIEKIKIPLVNQVSNSLQIETNNKLTELNIGGLSFGDDFTEVVNDGFRICWVFNQQILCNGNL